MCWVTFFHSQLPHQFNSISNSVWMFETGVFSYPSNGLAPNLQVKHFRFQGSCFTLQLCAAINKLVNSYLKTAGKKKLKKKKKKKKKKTCVGRGAPPVISSGFNRKINHDSMSDTPKRPFRSGLGLTNRREAAHRDNPAWSPERMPRRPWHLIHWTKVQSEPIPKTPRRKHA